jgi:hypothetical protein
MAYVDVWPALSLRTFGYLVAGGRYAGLLVFLAVAALIVWRRPRDRMGLIVALMLITLPLMFQLGGYSDTWLPYPPAWRPVLDAPMHSAPSVGMPALIAFAYLFPTGWPSPAGWAAWAVADASALWPMADDVGVTAGDGVWRGCGWSSSCCSWVSSLLALTLVLPLRPRLVAGRAAADRAGGIWPVRLWWCSCCSPWAR